MQGEFKFANPHGPCIMKLVTAVKSLGYISGSGNSAQITELIFLGESSLDFRLSQSRI
jgi:hypothetical protein